MTKKNVLLFFSPLLVILFSPSLPLSLPTESVVTQIWDGSHLVFITINSRLSFSPPSSPRKLGRCVCLALEGILIATRKGSFSTFSLPRRLVPNYDYCRPYMHTINIRIYRVRGSIYCIYIYTQLSRRYREITQAIHYDDIKP